MKRVIALLIFALFSGLSIAHADACDTDTINQISTNGDVLIMASGHVYRVDDSSAFSGDEQDDVVICATSSPSVYRIVDTSTGDEAYGAELR
ncbi:MAG TPA: hypothetical protein VKV57_02350 [bacterium]|nr:hypothetical protein [bacterium]